MNNTTQHAASSTVHWLLTSAGAAGIAALFVSFTDDLFAHGISPIEAVLDESSPAWRFAMPLFLAVPALLAAVHWIISGSLTTAERAIAYAVSASMACVTLWLLFIDFGWPASIQEWLISLSAPSILALGAYALIRNSRLGTRAEFNPIMAIQVAYLAHAVMLLMIFSGALDLGAWFVLTAVLAYALQIILVSLPPGQRPQDLPV